MLKCSECQKIILLPVRGSSNKWNELKSISQNTWNIICIRYQLSWSLIIFSSSFSGWSTPQSTIDETTRHFYDKFHTILHSPIYFHPAYFPWGARKIHPKWGNWVTAMWYYLRQVGDKWINEWMRELATSLNIFSRVFPFIFLIDFSWVSLLGLFIHIYIIRFWMETRGKRGFSFTFPRWCTQEGKYAEQIDGMNGVVVNEPNSLIIFRRDDEFILYSELYERKFNGCVEK